MWNPTTEPGIAGRLSVSMIVRNEARRIPRCIASLAPIASEICMVDTGSTDETVEVARSLGCVVSHFPWCDDFAAARNAALTACRCPWILSIDADERLAREDWAGIAALVRQPPACAYRFETRNYTDVTTASGFEPVLPGDPLSEGFPGWFPSSKVRLFPNCDAVRFEGAVHELLNASLAREGIPIAETGIPIHHYPLLEVTEGALKAKQQLYLALGKKKIAASPQDARLHSELGDQYVDMGDIASAVKAYKNAVALEPEEGRWLKNLGAALFLLEQFPQAEKALRLSVSLDPSQEEGWRNLGVVLLRREAWAEAREVLTRALTLNDRQPDTYRYLAIAEHHAGATDRAVALLETMLTRYPEHHEGRVLLKALSGEQT